MLLVTIALVLVAAVTLLIGIISDNLALIFISIGASAIAAIVLGVLSQMSRKKGKSGAGAAAPVSRGNGGFEVTTSDGATAVALATVLRERAGVLWAHSMLVDAALSRTAPETEFHGRMLSLTLNAGANAPAVVTALRTCVIFIVVPSP